MLVTGLAVLVGLAISIVEDIRFARENTKAQLEALADVVAGNASAALVLEDQGAAHNIMRVLVTNALVTHAQIIDGQQSTFTSYQQAPNDAGKVAWLSAFPSLTTVTVTRSIKSDELAIGTLKIDADIATVWEDLITQWLAKLAVLSTIFLVSYLVLKNTSKHVIEPVRRLTKAISDITSSGDYSLRVEATTNDELGALTEEFNSMLAQIEDRDSQLQHSNEALAQVQEPIILRDINLQCQYVNRAFTDTFGYTLEELAGQTFTLEVKGQEAPERTEEEVYAIAKNEGVYRGEGARQAKDGNIIPVYRHISPIKDKQGEVKGYVTVLSDISEKKDAEEIIWRQANFDALTGLPNRLMFTHRLKQELSKVNRSGLPLALMFLDLDHFKEINDTLGHDMGDVLLKDAARRILNCLRGASGKGYMENVARLGGDEFTIVLSELSDIKGVDVVAERVLSKMAEPFQLGKEVVHISASIGIVLTYPNDELDTDTLIKYADIAMYDAKQKGRNRASYFSEVMLMEAQKRGRLINDIHKALKNGEFFLVYQPIVDMHTNEIYKAEALIRWKHPTEGMVNPVDFISVAEDTGLIIDIGNWVFEEATKQVLQWRQQLHKDFQISINQSPIQLHAADEEPSWPDQLKALNLPGNCVSVEITEGVFLHKDSVVTDKLKQYREAGMQISLDDFGTGYSSLSYLLKFEFDYIKIDKSFVRNLSLNSDDMVFCEAMIVMAEKLGIKVIAEGIETQVQLGMLLKAGCNFGQGYLIAKPLPPAEFERMHQSRDTADFMLTA